MHCRNRVLLSRLVILALALWCSQACMPMQKEPCDSATPNARRSLQTDFPKTGDASGKVRVQQSEGSLQFRLSEAPRGAGQVMVLRFSLHNASQEQTFWVNYRMATGARLMPGTEVAIEVRDKDGRPLKYACMDKRGAAKAHYYMVLKRGAEVSVVAELRCFVFPGPGDYTIQAYYDDTNNTPPPSPPGISPYFPRQLKSNRLLVRVPEKP